MNCIVSKPSLSSRSVSRTGTGLFSGPEERKEGQLVSVESKESFFLIRQSCPFSRLPSEFLLITAGSCCTVEHMVCMGTVWVLETFGSC